MGLAGLGRRPQCWPPGECYCLFDMLADKTEHHDRAREEPAVAARLLERWAQLGEGYLPPPNPPLEMAAYCENIDRHKGFVAPWR